LDEEYKEVALGTIDGANTTPALWHLQKKHRFEKRRGKNHCAFGISFYEKDLYDKQLLIEIFLYRIKAG